MPARETVNERDDRQGGAYRLELVRCGKDRCTRCAGGPAHGPYWYRYYRGRGGKVVSRYVGKELPAAGREQGPQGGREPARGGLMDQTRAALRLDVPCPRCGAGFSQPCRTMSGGHIMPPRVHAERETAWTAVHPGAAT